MSMPRRVPSDAVKAIFHFIGNRRFPADSPNIHRAFYRMAQQPALALILNDFVFDQSRAYPYSSTVAFALDRLQKSNLLECINPGLDMFQVSEMLATETKIEELFTDAERGALREGAAFFCQEVAC